MPIEIVVVFSDPDPVARAVAAALGTLPTLERTVEGVPMRRWTDRVAALHRPGLHIHDDGLRVELDGVAPTLVFPSVHRSAGARETLTVHPLGNLGATAEVGGRPRTLVPTDPRRMADALRRLAEVGDRLGWPTSYEATHHGPALDQPAFFAEIGARDFAHPPADAVRGLAELLPEIAADPRDRIVVGLGGGHYAPHFTELARERRWAFGHLLPRHALEGDARPIIAEALRTTPGAEGFLYHRAQDANDAPWAELGPRRHDKEAPRRVAE